jgi:hypothetical protein
MKGKYTNNFIIFTFVALYIVTSLISTIHSIAFFEMSNPYWLAVSLAIAFEIGAAASLASIIAMKKMNQYIVWTLFFVLTAMQAMGNAYYAYVNLNNYTAWVELFGLVEYEPITQKRILAIISGGILPLVALGFIKSLVDYLKVDEPIPTVPPNAEILVENVTTTAPTPIIEVESIVEPTTEDEKKN